MKTRRAAHIATLLSRTWLSKTTFEIILSMPPQFEFKPGQRISLSLEEYEREYSIISAPGESGLSLCIRKVAVGKLSILLSKAEIGTPVFINGPHGYFTYKSSPRPAVFVATGTGIAPFCSMARSGIAGFTILHGVRLPEDLYYADLFQQNAAAYIPCLSESKKLPANAFQGKVTHYLEHRLEPDEYDFYLCGRREMIRDVTFLIDERFPESRVYTEIFY